jgi:xylulokinase
MTRAALMGLDLGTTAVKAGIFAAGTGEPLGVARAEYTPTSPRAGWLELDAREYWRAAVEATRAAHVQAGAPHVAGIGLSSQGQTFVPLDHSRRPLRPAIVWLDTRADEQVRRLNELLPAEELRRHRGATAINAVDSAPKLLWLREHEPEVWAATRHVVMLPDYLGLLMTGELRLDLSNAASTALVDHVTDDWWDAGLAAVGLPREWLSPLGHAGETIGWLTEAAARELGLEAGVPVALGCNDQLAGAVGAGNVEPGLASGTAGTAMAIVTTLRALPEPPPEGLLMGRHAVPGLFFLLTYAKTSGVLLTWLRDLLGGGDYEALLAEAAGAPVGCDGLVCLPHFSGTATPTFRNEVRGGFVGLTLGHGRAHLLRAAAEAVCFCARDAVALAAGAASRAGSPTYDTAANRGGGPMCGPGAAARPAPNAVRRRPLRDGGGQSSRQRTQGEARADAEASAPTIRELRMLGGAAQSDWWMQMMADVVRLPIAVPACADAAVLGAAIFGGVAAGLLESIEKGGREFYRPERRFTPNESVASAYAAAWAAYRMAMERLWPGALGITTGNAG